MTYIQQLAETLNKESSGYEIGELQNLRAKLKGLSRTSTKHIFDPCSTSEDWAFHYGGRTEIQFNIGREILDGREYIRHGLAFSLELSQTLPSIDALLPKLQRYNEYISANAAEYSDFRVWHFKDRKRSENIYPAPIPKELVSEGVFIFFGALVPQYEVNTHTILAGVDRLLNVYEYVESESENTPSVRRQPESKFIPGNSVKNQSRPLVLQSVRSMPGQIRSWLLQ